MFQQQGVQLISVIDFEPGAIKNGVTIVHPQQQFLVFRRARVRGLSGEDAEGELYICAGLVDGRIYKIVPTSPPCPWDLDDDGNVGVGDLLALFALWGPCPGVPGCPGDFNSDGAVGVGDMLILFANWGPCS